MRLTSYASVTEFRDVAERFLLTREAEYNLQLGLANRIATGEIADFYLATAHDPAGAVVGALVYTPPRKLLLTRMPNAAIGVVAEHGGSRWPNLFGVQGPVDEVNAFVRRWARPGHEGARQGIYELQVVVPPATPLGASREARASDISLLAKYRAGFARDVGLEHVAGHHRRRIERLVTEDRMIVWVDAGDVPVSMAAVVRETPNGSCVSLVYTPPGHRGRGYASATVAALSQRCLDRGKTRCFLFTDLSNRTSNAIYQRVGYREVAQAVEVLFGRPGDPSAGPDTSPGRD